MAYAGFWIFLGALAYMWAQCVCSNLVAKWHMDAFVGAGLVTIMVNHEAAELVANVDRLVDVATINGPDKPILSVGATTTLGALEVTFLEMVARSDYPDRWILDL